ncbi:uncharacterized protein [Fopius arisanus]|uniref:TPX2 C-terminal domain-containing protein n=2 Tax=Fopius arisanus TaxID=64838 RepID=A0A9R1U8S0_9HYME|nr:PREDICTED: uncharacterized protein LOC105272644 [Fopius arisanus]
MEVAFESDAAIIFDKLEKESTISWTSADLNQVDYRNSWCQYRNSGVENKENIEPVINDGKICVEENDEGVRPLANEAMEIVMTFSACSIAVTDTLQKNNSILDPPPVKRARIVKPPEANKSSKKIPGKIEPFSFLARERENREKTEARRNYYEMLTNKSSPRPFKARAAPKFKPLPETPTRFVRRKPLTQAPTSKTKSETLHKFVLNKSSPQTQTPMVATPKRSTLQPIHALSPIKPTGRVPPSVKPITSPKSSVSQSITTTKPKKTTGISPQTPRQSIIPKMQIVKTTPSSSVSQTSNKPTENTVQPKMAVKRGFNSRTIPKGQKITPVVVVQSSKPMRESSQIRSVTIPKSPRLSTAIRARERRQFDEMMEEKLRQRNAVRKMEIATTQRYEEQQDVVQLRKSMIYTNRCQSSPQKMYQ